MKILFVCSSNICRSPFCEYILKREIRNNPALKSKIEWVKSAAVFNQSFVIHPKARLALKREGFSDEEISKHRPVFKWFSPKRFREADVIIGMSKLNKPFVPFWWQKKFITISELVDGEYSEVPDPWLYKDIERYYAVMDRLKDYVERYAKQIENDKNR